MGKSHENILEVLIMIDDYTYKGDSFFTVPDLWDHIVLSGYGDDLSERTVRRCVSEIESKGFLEYREIGNQTVYVVTDEDLIPSSHNIYNR